MGAIHLAKYPRADFIRIQIAFYGRSHASPVEKEQISGVSSRGKPSIVVNGEALRTIRIERGFSQEKLAALASAIKRPEWRLIAPISEARVRIV